MNYLPPNWRLLASSPFPGGDVGRRQQAFLAPLPGKAQVKRIYLSKENLYG